MTMRRVAGIGTLLLVLAGCRSLPSLVRIEIGGATLEYKKTPPPSLEPSAPNAAADAPAP
jgi:hypothetical protein